MLLVRDWMTENLVTLSLLNLRIILPIATP